MIPTLSFCITCKNRFHQISKTLRKNLDDNLPHFEWIEFILVDFGSTDGLRDWILNNFSKELESKFLKYYYTDDLHYWHASVAKNIAHQLSNNDILVNLDCDNYTGYLGGQFVIREFLQDSDIVLHQFSRNYSDGSFGRISTHRKYFEIIKGYDESFEPMSYQDIDLIDRLKQLGLNYKLQSNSRFCQAIPNSKSESIALTNSSQSYREMLLNNTKKSIKKIDDGNLISSNNNRFQMNIVDNCGFNFFL